MVSRAEILVHGSADDVAEALAARLMSRLVEIQRDARTPQVALTGGRIATKAYQRIGLEGRSSAVDWSRVGLWWGDERFVAADDDDRNARQALTALSAAAPRPGAGAPDAGRRRRARSRRGRRGLRRRARPDRVRHLPARDGAGRPRRVALPRAPVLVRRRAGHPGAVLPQASAGTDLADPRGDQPGGRGVVLRHRRGQGRRGPDWRCPAPARCRSPPPASRAGSGRCGCWTASCRRAAAEPGSARRSLERAAPGSVAGSCRLWMALALDQSACGCGSSRRRRRAEPHRRRKLLSR